MPIGADALKTERKTENFDASARSDAAVEQVKNFLRFAYASLLEEQSQPPLPAFAEKVSRRYS